MLQDVEEDEDLVGESDAEWEGGLLTGGGTGGSAAAPSHQSSILDQLPSGVILRVIILRRRSTPDAEDRADLRRQVELLIQIRILCELLLEVLERHLTDVTEDRVVRFLTPEHLEITRGGRSGQTVERVERIQIREGHRMTERIHSPCTSTSSAPACLPSSASSMACRSARACTVQHGLLSGVEQGQSSGSGQTVGAQLGGGEDVLQAGQQECVL